MLQKIHEGDWKWLFKEMLAYDESLLKGFDRAMQKQSKILQLCFEISLGISGLAISFSDMGSLSLAIALNEKNYLLEWKPYLSHTLHHSCRKVL